jgi:hypothetical protein
MNNYWLSESPGSDDAMDDGDNPEPKDRLTPRQQSLYDYYESVVEEFGMFDQTSKANGAHYAPEKVNPFVKEGLICGNCVFYLGGNGCELVKGSIEPHAICKLWIIPEDLITIKK